MRGAWTGTLLIRVLAAEMERWTQVDAGTAGHGLNQEDAGCQLEAPGVTRLPGTLRVTGIEEAVAGSTASWTCMRWREVLAAQTAQEC